jgi:hypothetical protein
MKLAGDGSLLACFSEIVGSEGMSGRASLPK